jgi:histidinol-phosphate aminotransferase
MAPRIKDSILKISPYKAGESKVEGVAKVIKLSSNENTAGPSPLAIEAYRAAADRMAFYPDPTNARLRLALADHWKLEADRIITGTGSDHILDLLCLAYAGPGDEVLFPEVTFPMYEIAALTAGATPVKAAMKGDTISVDALIERANEKTKLVYLANPNNPTGHWLPKDEVQRLRAGLPDDTLLVLDSAYAEYVEDESYTAGADLVKDAIESGANNVIMTRTFSKMFALAGLRVGWAYGPDDVIGAIGRIRAPFAVSVPAEEAALAALADGAHFEAALALNSEWLPTINGRLRDLGFHVTEGAGNFAFFRVPEALGSMAELDAHLKASGIIVRAFPPLGALRVTVGLRHENEAFLAAVEAYVKGRG